jgi:hypothetical protein
MVKNKRIKYLMPVRTEYNDERPVSINKNDPRNADADARRTNGRIRFLLKYPAG